MHRISGGVRLPFTKSADDPQAGMGQADSDGGTCSCRPAGAVTALSVVVADNVDEVVEVDEEGMVVDAVELDEWWKCR